MSGVVSVGAAVGATAFAAASVGSVGLTIGSAFAITAAVGATLGAVGYFAKSKELQIAGAALGAVGLVGGLASAAGMFGSAGSLFGSGMQGVGTGAEVAQAASAAAETAGWANVAPAAISSAAPTTGYGAFTGDFATGGVAGQVDAISMVNGTASTPLTASAPNVAPATAAAPSVTPEFQVPGAAPDATAATAAETVSPFAADQPPPPLPEASPVSGEVANPGRSLINGDQSLIPKPGEFSPMPVEQNMTPAQLDPSGRIIPGGDADPSGGQLGAGVGNPAAPTAGMQNNPAPPPVTGTAAPQPSGIAGAGNTPPSVPGVDAASSAQSASSAAMPTEWAGGVAGKTQNLTPATSTWDGLLNWVQKNQMLSYGAIQTFGSFISGAIGRDDSPEVAAELASRREQNEAAKRLYDTQQQMLQRRMDNMNQSVPVASRQSYGLINGGAAAVTGRV